MRITYYALRPIQVGDEIRQAGDLVPEANTWSYLSGYVQDGKLAPVLVVTLPDEVQDMLLAWEAEQDAAVVTSDDTASVPADEPVKSEAPKPGARSKEKVA